MERTNKSDPHRRTYQRFRVDGAANLMVGKVLEKPAIDGSPY